MTNCFFLFLREYIYIYIYIYISVSISISIYLSIYIYIYVYNLFTNVPVLETIIIIINNIYHHSMLLPLKINSNTLHKILLLCTTVVPFYGPHGKIFIQKDEIMMGSVLGPIFSNFYMSTLERRFLIPSINLIFI